MKMWRDQAPALMDIDETMLRVRKVAHIMTLSITVLQGFAVVDKESSARYWT